MAPNPSDVAFLHSIGKCASISPDGLLCTLSINHQPRQHMAQILGGPEDGKELAKWPW
jgi:hypothetical protein